MVLECCHGMPPAAAAAQIVKEAVGSKGLRDDTTCIVIDILPQEKPPEPLLVPKKPGKRMFKFIFRRNPSKSSSHCENKYLEPDMTQELFEEGSAMLSERLNSKYPLCNMFKLFICSICQIEMKPREGISIHASSSHSGTLRPWDGPFLCISCQEKKEAMEGKKDRQETGSAVQVMTSPLATSTF